MYTVQCIAAFASVRGEINLVTQTFDDYQRSSGQSALCGLTYDYYSNILGICLSIKTVSFHHHRRHPDCNWWRTKSVYLPTLYETQWCDLIGPARLWNEHHPSLRPRLWYLAHIQRGSKHPQQCNGSISTHLLGKVQDTIRTRGFIWFKASNRPQHSFFANYFSDNSHVLCPRYPSSPKPSLHAAGRHLPVNVNSIALSRLFRARRFRD